jgi:hypothetical protein
MRIFHSVHADRETIVSGSSPEPVIAEAAAQLMHSNINIYGGTKPYMNVWGLVVEYVESGLLPQGTVGELLGRVLRTFAMDRAIDNTPVKRDLKYQTPVKVNDYYQALLTDEAWEIVRRSVPANRENLSKESACKTFEDAFEDFYFHWSHYGLANDETPMRANYGWAAWLRGTAILCQRNQIRTDRAHPMVCLRYSERISEECSSVALEQDKTSPSENLATVAIQDAQILGIFRNCPISPQSTAMV